MYSVFCSFSLWAAFFIALLLTTVVYADDANEFTIPGPPGGKFDFDLNPIWPIDSTTILRWKTDWSKISLALWQYGNGTSHILLDKVDAQVRYAWAVNLTGLFDLDDGDIFFFTVYNAAGQGQFDSHYVNITDGGSNPSSSTTISSSVTVSPTSSPSPNSSSNTNASSSGLSVGAKIGIGVGTGVGGASLLGIAAVFLFRRRLKESRKSHVKSDTYGPGPPAYQAVPTEYAAYETPIAGIPLQHRTVMQQQQQQSSPQELSPGGVRAELGATSSLEARHELPSAPGMISNSPSRFGWRK